MAANDLIARVRRALARRRGVKEQRMFGGVAFMVNGKMCVTVRNTRLMCRIDPAIHDTVLPRKGARTMVMAGRRYQGYVHIEAPGTRTARDLGYWMKLALDYNKRAKSSRR